MSEKHLELSAKAARHPAYEILEEMRERRWTVPQVVSAFGGDEADVLALDMYLSIGPETPDMVLGDLAGKLAAAFDVAPEFFANLEASWRQA